MAGRRLPQGKMTQLWIGFAFLDSPSLYSISRLEIQTGLVSGQSPSGAFLHYIPFKWCKSSEIWRLQQMPVPSGWRILPGGLKV
jgi:hypothetical protein